MARGGPYPILFTCLRAPPQYREEDSPETSPHNRCSGAVQLLPLDQYEPPLVQFGNDHLEAPSMAFGLGEEECTYPTLQGFRAPWSKSSTFNLSEEGLRNNS